MVRGVYTCCLVLICSGMVCGGNVVCGVGVWCVVWVLMTSVGRISVVIWSVERHTWHEGEWCVVEMWCWVWMCGVYTAYTNKQKLSEP